MLAAVEEERRLAGGCLVGVVVGELDCWKAFVPIGLPIVDERAEHVFEGTVCSLSLAVSLRMVGS